MLCSKPTETCTTLLLSPVTGVQVGLATGKLIPSPSWPMKLFPQPTTADCVENLRLGPADPGRRGADAGYRSGAGYCAGASHGPGRQPEHQHGAARHPGRPPRPSSYLAVGALLERPGLSAAGFR
jgi:hypothetical protein